MGIYFSNPYSWRDPYNTNPYEDSLGVFDLNRRKILECLAKNGYYSKKSEVLYVKKWYDESKIETNDILKQINDDDVLIFDNLNKKNQIIIDNCENRKMLDLGQYFELENYSNNDIVEKIKNKFDFINLNERVEKYLINRFSIKSLEDIYSILHPKMIIVTRGKKVQILCLIIIKATKI